MSTGLTFTCSSSDLSFDPHVLRIDGHESLGALFEFVVHFSVDHPLSDADLDTLLTKTCSFTLDDGGAPLHGVLREIELVDLVETRAPEYRATVVPSAWLLTLSRISRVYQNQTVPEIAGEMLRRFGMIEEKDFVLRLYSTYEKRELYVQYEESDWQFLQRWFERDGLYYWFEHDTDGDRLVISDDNKGFQPIAGEEKVPHRDQGNLVRSEESVYAWNGRRGRTVARVILKDYNERNPAMPMVARADADKATGFGVVFAYGEHFADAAAGSVLAKKRAERLLVERVTVRGRTDSGRFHAGAKFELTEHFTTSQNGEYLLTHVTHAVRRQEAAPDAPEVPAATTATERPFVHTATFDAIPARTQFRAARSTPWPRIDGVMSAHIDSDASGEFSTLNDDTRYRVRFPFDSSGNQGDKSSSWVRMATSYTGAGYGSHSPLHKGAEVLLAFLGGNPDRPVIVGAVPNAHTPGPSAGKNATQSVTQSASGIRFVMDDKTTPAAKTS